MKCAVTEIVGRSHQGRTGVFRNVLLKSRDMSRAVWGFISRLLRSDQQERHQEVLHFPKQINSEVTERQKGNNS